MHHRYTPPPAQRRKRGFWRRLLRRMEAFSSLALLSRMPVWGRSRDGLLRSLQDHVDADEPVPEGHLPEADLTEEERREALRRFRREA